MKRLCVILLPFVLGLRALAADPAFTCTLSADRAVITQGECPQVKLTIKNNSAKEVTLVGSLDGSDVGWRFPKCGFELLDVNGKTLPLDPGLRCGNMNELRTADFVKVPAGAEFNPYADGFFSSWKFYHIQDLAPGTYLIRFYYQTATKGVHQYYGDESMTGVKVAPPAIHKLYEGVPLVDLKSNDLKITITPRQSKPARTGVGK